MRVTSYCVQHAEVGELVPAVGEAGGLSTCGAHEVSRGAQVTLSARRTRAARCADCQVTPHRAYFVVADRPLCIRHAADAVFADDDMRAHDLAHAAYLALGRMGVADAY